MSSQAIEVDDVRITLKNVRSISNAGDRAFKDPESTLSNDSFEIHIEFWDDETITGTYFSEHDMEDALRTIYRRLSE